MGVLGPTFFQGDTEAPAGALFHYTNRRALDRILQAGVLKPDKALADDTVGLGWASSSAVWEPASGRAVPWDRAQPQSFDHLWHVNWGVSRIFIIVGFSPARPSRSP